ncbi:MAG TPA: SpoIVB peptidase S55 domain-containing protein, partial [Abditibacteriaceae bacterium]
MIRRISPLALSLLSLSALLVSPVFSQTKPSTQVPAESRADANAIVNQLLRQGKIIRSSSVKRGMRGVARSVFQGTKIEEFPIEVLGVLSRVQGGSDLVLIKVLGGPVVKRQSGIIAGMSGSPVYINGKMLGAIAIGWGFPKEPIGGVTPITDMILTSLPDPARRKTVSPSGATSPAPAPEKANAPGTTGAPVEAYLPKKPLYIAGRKIARVEVSRDRKRLALAPGRDGSVMTMRPTTTMLQLSGFSPAALPMLRRAYEPYGIEPVIGPASKKTNVKTPPFIPGGAIGVQMVSGDMDQTAVGTITFRWGNRILAFGHPMFGQGATSLPMTASFVHEIFPSYQRSFKLASPIKVVGALQQDTQFAVGGTIGMVADTIPMTVSVRQADRQIAKTYRVRVMKDPVLTPILMGGVATEAIETSLGQTSDKMVRVGMRLEIDGAAPIVRRNYLYSRDVVTGAALADFGQSLALTQMNEFARGSIRRVDLDVSVEPVRKTARIKSLFADRNKAKAGESVRVNVVLEPSDTPGRTVTRTFTFQVPEDAPTGNMRIAAASASNYWAMQVRVGAAPPDPTNLKELVDAWGKIGAANT